jgi:hypothetical protein
MKLARGTGKATLPGELQVHRFADHDLVALAGEQIMSGGQELLQPVWRGRAALPQPTLEESRKRTRAQIDALPAPLRLLAGPPADAPVLWPLVASDGLVAKVEELMKESLT